MNIIITGNIGCGKSTVVNELRKHFPNHTVHSFDEMVHALYDNDDFCQFLMDNFGTIVRAQVSDRVFKDPDLKEALEQFSLGILNQEVAKVLNTRNAILEWPLYYEMRGNHRYSFHAKSIAISCSDETQLARIKARDDFSDEKIAAIRASQYSTDLKVAMSDYRFVNEDGNLVNDIKHLAMKLKVVLLEERALKFFNSPLVWPSIKTHYTEEHRHYHTLEHLAAMFDKFDEVKDQIPHAWEVELAIWFHDYIYDTDEGYQNNEINSVRHMMHVLAGMTTTWPVEDRNGETIPATQASNYAKVILAAEFILSTKGHKVKAPSVMVDATKRLSNEYMLDIDLSILGASQTACDVFDDNIRKEFSQYPDDQFAKSRVQAMREFKDRQRIFYTDHFHEQYNSNARVNLKNIIKKWS